MKVDKYEKKIYKCEKLICSLNDKQKYEAYMRNLKQASNHDFELKKRT